MTLRNYLKILQKEQESKFQLSKKEGLLDEKIKKTKEILKSCELCERKCRVNRLQSELGFCKVGGEMRIFGAHTHWGEEEELIPSATLFLAGCTMRCAYCQNAPESIKPELGMTWPEKKAAQWVEDKFNEHCKNVNFVGGEPTPYLYNILQCLQLCNVSIPVVWNSNAYYGEKTAQLLSNVIDIYLLDFRYFSDECSVRLSSASNYVAVAKRNFLAANEDAELLIRVLVLPNHIECCAKPILKWIKESLGRDTQVNILGQYYPYWRANELSEINRKLTSEEYAEIVNYAEKIDLKNFIVQKCFYG